MNGRAIVWRCGRAGTEESTGQGHTHGKLTRDYLPPCEPRRGNGEDGERKAHVGRAGDELGDKRHRAWRLCQLIIQRVHNAGCFSLIKMILSSPVGREGQPGGNVRANEDAGQ